MYDFVSDVWSIGIITIEAITGQHPYKSQNFIAISMSVTNQPSPTPPADTPAEIAEFVGLCLLKEPKGVNGRPGVRTLVHGAWLKECSRMNCIGETEKYLRQQKGL